MTATQGQPGAQGAKAGKTVEQRKGGAGPAEAVGGTRGAGSKEQRAGNWEQEAKTKTQSI